MLKHPLSILDLQKPEYAQDPYPLYHQLRNNDPIYWDERFRGWILTRHADVIAVLRDSRFTAERAFKNPSQIPEKYLESIGQAMRVLERQMLFRDPPDHTRMRSLVARAFTPRIIESLAPFIQQEVDMLLDEIIPQGQMEVIADFAYPLPSTVIASLLGIPPEDHSQFIKWSNDFGALIDGTNTTIEGIIRLLQGISECTDYFREIIRRHKSAPKDDLIQAMIAAEEQGDRLNEDEVLGNLVLVLSAGHITTTHLIGNGLLALLRDPEQLQLLKDNPKLISSAIVEFLRYDSPTQSTERLPRHDLEFGGRQFKQGQSILLCMGAGNHDPEQFSNPDRLNISRTENKHLAFGHGAHFCLGAPLARLEAEIAFSTLLRRIKQPRLLLKEPERASSVAFRSVKQLPIAFN